MYARAIEYGVVEIMLVAAMEYGDRQGGVKDAEGKSWWITKRIKEEPYQNYE